MRGRYLRTISAHNNSIKSPNIVFQAIATRHSTRVLGFVGQALIRANITFCLVVRQFFSILDLEIACLGVAIFSNIMSLCIFVHTVTIGLEWTSAHNTL